MTALCPGCQKRRKDEHHRHFMAVVAAAFLHWPEWEPFKPKDADDLRYELMFRAGQTESIELDGADVVTIDAIKLAKSFFAPGKPAKMQRTETGLRIMKPKSIANRPTKKELMDISGPVFSEIEKVIGYSVDRLIKETESAA